jgi:hypothetical protein
MSLSMSDSSIERRTETPTKPEGAPKELSETLLEKCVGGLGNTGVPPDLVELLTRPDLK